MRKIILCFVSALVLFNACEKIVLRDPTLPIDTTVDKTSPTVTLTNPENNLTGVALNHQIVTTFSEPMDPTTITASTFTLTHESTLITGTVTYAGTNATFTSINDLQPNTIYSGTITTGAKDLAGNALGSNYTFSFTTGSAAVIVLPVVNSTDPISNATGIVFNKPVDITFSEAMDPLTINASTFTLKQGTTAVAGTISYTGTKATFTPSSNLSPNSIYTGTLSTGIKDLLGFALISDYTFSFTTALAPDITPPTVTSVDPINNAIGVTLSKAVAVNFSESMNAGTINATTFTLKQGTTNVTGTVAYSGTQATFTPALNLDLSKTYTGTITTGAKDLAGNALSSNFTFSFTTGSAPDIAPPLVNSTDPINNATGVVLTKVIAVTFNEAMTSSSINTSTFTLKQGTTAVSGTVTLSGTTASYIPSSTLVPNSIYYGTINTGVKDLAGNTMSSVYNFSFTTGAAPDITPPTVIASDPLNNATGVAFNKVIAVTFSEAMNPSSINTSTFTLKQGTIPVLGSVSYTGTQAKYTPSSTLAPNSTFTATITKEAMDLAGNTLSSNYTFSFTTDAAAVIVLPVVNSTDPINNATGVVFNKPVDVTFSEAMDPATINASTFTIKQGTTAVAGTISYTGAKATFTPTSNLAPNSVYTGTITTGVKNTTGFALISNYTFSFTTAAAPDITPPTVIASDPLNNATGVAFNKVVAVTFSEAMNPSSINTSTFTLKLGATSVTGNVTYSGTQATFTPSSRLAPNSTFTGTISTGAMDVTGNTLGSNFTFTFTTTAAPDVTAPTVSSTDPPSNATGIVTSKVIAVTFSEAINTTTVTTSTFTLNQGTTAITGTVALSGTTASFTPSALLTAGTVYTATITTGVKDLTGNSLAATNVWSFTTAGTAPVVLSFATDVAPVLAMCNNCHTHGWTSSSNASTFYTNLVNSSYVKPTSYTTSSIYTNMNNGHVKTSFVSTTNFNKIINWMKNGSKNN